MSPTARTLIAEADRLMDLANRLRSFAAEIEVGSNGHDTVMLQRSEIRTNVEATGRFSGMTQKSAILSALQAGPLTTRELWVKLSEGGIHLKKPVYVTALIGRLRSEIERRDDGRLQLKQETH